MKKIISLLLFFIIGIPFLKAQNDTIVIEQKDTIIVSDTSSSNNALTDFVTYFIEKNKKRNSKSSFKKWDDKFYFSMGLIFGDIENSSADFLYGQSYNCDFGIKTIYNVSSIYALTFNIGFSYNRYEIANGIKNGIFKFSPVDLDNSDYVITGERFRTWAFGITLGNRFKFGSTSKSYLELGVYGNYAYCRDYTVSFSSNDVTKGYTRYQNPTAFSPFEAGAQINLGLGWFSIWGRYRVTDWFSSKVSNAELPKFSVGAVVYL